jgi:hypothetical protein
MRPSPLATGPVTFPQFPRLPTEIRRLIFEHAALTSTKTPCKGEPYFWVPNKKLTNMAAVDRHMYLHLDAAKPRVEYTFYMNYTTWTWYTIPALLMTSWEAREIALWYLSKKISSDIRKLFPQAGDDILVTPFSREEGEAGWEKRVERPFSECRIVKWAVGTATSKEYEDMAWYIELWMDARPDQRNRRGLLERLRIYLMRTRRRMFHSYETIAP